MDTLILDDADRLKITAALHSCTPEEIEVQLSNALSLVCVLLSITDPAVIPYITGTINELRPRLIAALAGCGLSNLFW